MSEPQSPPGMPLAPRRTPEAYVRAEVASFPLASREAFRSAMVQLNPLLDGATGGKTRALWAHCEEQLSQHAGGWSLDRLIIARDFFWFGFLPGAQHAVEPRPVSMARYLRTLSRIYLEAAPGRTRLKQGFETNSFDASTHYRWLTFALPEDLLLAATDAEPPPTGVGAEPPMLLRHLADRGVVEIHHHIGAGMDFPLLWAALQARLADPALAPSDLDSPALPFDSGELLLTWLLVAAVSRCVLAEFLVQTGGTGPTLRGFLSALSTGTDWTFGRRRLLLQALDALADGQREELPDVYRLRELYRDLHPLRDGPSTNPPPTLDALWRRCDPIAVRLGLHIPNGGERWLVRHAMTYLEQREREPGDGDALFARLFWQLQRARCIYYRSVVQRPMTAGLQWFVRFYDRLGWARVPLRAARAEVSFAVAGKGQPLSGLEVRIAPSESPFALAEDLRGLTRSWAYVLEKTRSPRHGRREPEFGVIVHLLKERDLQRRWAAGIPPGGERQTHAEPHPRGDQIRLGGRFAEFFSHQTRRARALVDLLRAVPQALWLVRGLDVASDELGVPTWVMVPLYRYIEREAALAAVAPASLNAPPLRLTAHVGEDFRHLMEGMRRVYECIQYLLGGAGGRLGHATALGINPRRWAESTGSVMMMAEERLWDLVFEWRLYSRYRVDPQLQVEAPSGRPEQVENLIRQLSGSIFHRCQEPQVLAEAHHVLHQLLCRPISRVAAGGSLDAFVRALKNLDPEQVRNYRQVRQLLQDYREDETVFLRGRDLVDITLDASEVSALLAVQNALRREVGLRGLVVEVNPSSNLLIGDMMDLRSHPILRLFPPEREEGAPPPVPIAVGSDDPITFSTWLLREYALLHEAGLMAGYSERVVHDWLETIQKIGMDARFTVPWHPSARRQAERLLDALEDYLQLPQSSRTRFPAPGSE
ncbi:hypothetical protein [Pyxidicoccus trucidator]|uniref:hypothetical protein n=1 Tax=Pyxidicoccus trucidator TaxID=2709662 RepID=UPI001967C585|nr:hypothetical protein [Pyxidicoccus trucidator]